MKPILSFKIEQGKYKRSEIDTFQKYVEEKFGEEYDILFTIFDVTNPTDDTTLLCLNGIGYTYAEIISLLQPQERGQRAAMNICDEKMDAETRKYVLEGLAVEHNRESFKKYPPINI